MSCDCDNPIKICVELNPCNTGTYIGINATETGTWVGKIYFNGAVKKFGVEVTEGDEIAILTSLLNEDYVHEFKLYDTTGELVDCYKLHTELTQSVSDAPIPPVADGSWDWHSLTASGNTLVSDYFTGELSPIIWLDSNPLEWSAAGIIQDDATGTLDLTNIGGYTGTISFQYRNLNP